MMQPKICLQGVFFWATVVILLRGAEAKFHCSSHIDTDYATGSEVRAATDCGTVVGRLYRSVTGVEAQVYQGIPYATQKRFEYAERVRRFASEPLDCTRPPAICHQFLFGMAAEQHESEDCLVVNVVAPNKRPDEKFPVIVWVHGGAFSGGYSYDMGYDGIIDNYISRNVVFIGVQYRLGPLGFLYTEGVDAKPNLGLYDIHTAVAFVSANAAAFGGDASRITLMGESAGAIAVSLVHSANPAPMVQGSIIMSLSQLSDVYAHPRVATDLLAEATGCEYGGGSDFTDCLKGLDVQSIKEALRDLPSIVGVDSLLTLHWGPVPDGRMVPANLTESAMRRRGSVMIGTTTDDIALFTSVLPLLAGDFAKDCGWLERIAGATIGRMRGTVRRVDTVRRAALDRYLHAAGMRCGDESHALRAISDLAGDAALHAPALREARLSAGTAGNRVWMYDFAIHNQKLVAPYDAMPTRGPVHVTDLFYAFAKPFMPIVANAQHEFDGDDCRVIENFTAAIAAFAAGGDPRPATDSAQCDIGGEGTGCGADWDAWQSWPALGGGDDTGVHLRIDVESSLRPAFHPAADAFWNRFVIGMHY